MKRSFKPSEKTKLWIVRVICTLTACLIAWWSADWLPKLLHIENLNLDVRSSLLSIRPAHQSKAITIVGIDDRELTQAKLPYVSPVDRAYLASVITKVAAYKPRLIVLDFVFDRPTELEKDLQLQTTLRNLKVPIVLAYVDQRSQNEDIEFESSFLGATGRPYGYANLLENSDERPNDFEVSRIPGGVSNNTAVCSLSEMAVNISCKSATAEDRAIDWLLSPKDGRPLFSTLFPRDIPELSNSVNKPLTNSTTTGPEEGSDLQSKDPRIRFVAPLLSGRIVLIGGLFNDQDQHKTPITSMANFFESGNLRNDWEQGTSNLSGQMPGVIIQAQAIQQLLDHRFEEDLNPFITAIAMFIVALAGTIIASQPFFARHFRFYLFVASVILMILDGAAFVLTHAIVPGNAIVLAFAISVFLAYYNVEVMAEKRTFNEDGEPVEDVVESRLKGFAHFIMELLA